MNNEMKQMQKIWSEKHVLKLKKEGCGMINCRSKLRSRNPVRDEIQQILDQRFRQTKR